MASALTVDGLQTHFFTRAGVVKAVDGVSFTVNESEVLAIVGESGSGKSVTALSILRLVPNPPGRIVGGQVLFDGRDLLQLPERDIRAIRGNKISMIFQEPMTALNPVMTIGDQIQETVIGHAGASRQDARRRAIDLLDLVQIPEPHRRVDDFPHRLSGGMRQRVMIAMALACQPKILIADEPTTALDVTIQAQVLDLLRRLQAEFGMGIALITHDLGVVAETAHRVVVMYAGRKAEEAAVDDLFKRPLHPYTQGLLRASAAPVEERRDRSRRLTEIPGTVPSLLDLGPGCAFAARCVKAMERCRRERPGRFEPLRGREVYCFAVEQEFGADAAASLGH